MKKIVPDVIIPQNLVVVSGDTTVRAAAKLMATHKMGAVLVGEGTTLRGIFTERDLMTKVVAADRDPDRVRLIDVMTSNPDTIAPDDTPRSALERMDRRGYRHLPVVENGKLIGIVSSRDIHAAVVRDLEDDLQDRDLALFR